VRPLSSTPPTDTALVRRAAFRLALHATAATLLVIATLITVVGVLLARDADVNEASQLTITADRADDATGRDGSSCAPMTGSPRRAGCLRGCP
jgi:hypothetical protein